MALTPRQQLDALLDSQPPQVAAAFRAAIQDVVDNVILAQVVEAIERNDVEAAWRALGYSRAAMNPLVLALEQVFQNGGVMMAATFPRFIPDATGTKSVFRFNMRDPEAERWLRDKSSTLITGIEADIRTNVRDTLTAGLEAGRNPRSVALDIVGRINQQTGQREGGIIGLADHQELWARSARQKLLTLDAGYFDLALRDKRFDATVQKAILDEKPFPVDVVDKLISRYRANALRYRGETIGRTEALAALNRSEWESTRQAFTQTGGLVGASAVTREWDTAGDNHVRSSHRAMDRQRVGLDEPFVTPRGERLMHPGDTSLGASAQETIACRCRVRTVVDFFAGVS